MNLYTCYLFFNQENQEVEEDSMTTQKIITVSQSRRMESCQGTKSLASFWEYGRKFRRNINTIAALMENINTIVLPFLLLSSR